MSENPYSSPDDSHQAKHPESLSTEKAAYNIVTDTVVGINARGSDNWFQAKFILVSVLVLTALFTVLAVLNPSWQLPWFGGAMVGAFLGLLFGVLFSGVFLMIYRGVRHLNGKHD